MQVCTSLQTDNHASTHHSVFLQAGCPSCRPTNSVKALKGNHTKDYRRNILSSSQWSWHTGNGTGEPAEKQQNPFGREFVSGSDWVT